MAEHICCVCMKVEDFQIFSSVHLFCRASCMETLETQTYFKLVRGSKFQMLWAGIVENEQHWQTVSAANQRAARVCVQQSKK